MIDRLVSFWGDYLSPFLHRPEKLQMAALCHRGSGAKRRVLLVTSRGSGRWIIPKGWPIRGLNSSEVAMQEAWEEAGVRKGRASAEPIGTFSYDKELDSGLPVPVKTLVYAVEVEDMVDTFPEADERTRKWAKPEDAAEMIQEDELKDILRQM